jgi:hypothetical protein
MTKPKRIDPMDHEIQYTATFNRHWDDYWAVCRPMIAKPTEAQKLAMLQKVTEVLPEEVGFEVWNGRRTFKHHDMDGRILYAALEGVTSYKPNGCLVFLGMGPWRTGRIRHPDDLPPKFLPPSETWPWVTQRRFAERKAEECRLWCEVNGVRHPNYRDVRRTWEQYLHLLEQEAPPDDDRSAMAELEEVRDEVRRMKTGI